MTENTIDFKKFQVDMRLAVMDMCSGDRFKTAIHMSTNTLMDLTEHYHQQRYEETEETIKEQAKFAADIINAEYKREKNQSIIGFFLDRLSGKPTVLERRLSTLKENAIKSYFPTNFDLLSSFMGRPIIEDETVPYGEFRLEQRS